MGKNASQGRDLVDRWLASDLSQEEFCERECESRRSLRYWVKRFDTEQRLAGQDGLIPVPPPPPPPTGRLAVELPNGLRIVCEAEACPTTVAAWVGALTSC